MCKWLTIAAFLIGLVGTGLLKNSTSVLAASSDVGYRDFSYSTSEALSIARPLTPYGAGLGHKESGVQCKERANIDAFIVL
jgi:hypothetical protein